jgi:hypothetical protein
MVIFYSAEKALILVCNLSVAIEPGLMVLTRTPSLIPRSARTFVRFISAALTVPPMVNSAEPVRPPMPTMLMMPPLV